mmetsp:Transcript_88064/g.158785  ORF Transcript_88064/g.158785 Transcript_88064/m.158785 type:complete len:229 (+) Transcript_88064:1709-2395(+)
MPTSTSSTSVPASTPSTSLAGRAGQGAPQSRPKKFLRGFKADMGHTTGCQACETGGSGSRRTVSCKARQEAYRQRLAMREIPDETSAPPLSLSVPEHDEGMPRAPAKRGMPEENVEPSRRVPMRVKGPAAKRPAEPTPQDDEEEVCIRIQDDVVGVPDDTAGYTDSLQVIEEECPEAAARNVVSEDEEVKALVVARGASDAKQNGCPDVPPSPCQDRAGMTVVGTANR